MRVLIWLEPGAREIPGGHQVQIDETARWLGDLGHEVVVEASAAPDLSRNFDVVHGLGLTPEQVRAARLARLPVVMSTIWWPVSYMRGEDMPWTPRRVRNVALRSAHGLSDAVRGRNPGRTALEQRARAFESSMILLPNGPGEAAAVRADTRVSTPFMTVPNGVDTARFTAGESPREDFILMVGRVEPHKNQLGAIRALRELTRPIVVAGPPHPHHLDYFKKCERALASRGEMLGRVSHEVLVSLYQRTAVHVLPSWFETTGLASLEAAASGAPIVTTERGFARDYFGDLAAYCDPGRPATIAEAVKQVAGTRQSAVMELVRSKYTWRRAADRTQRAYEVAIGQRPATDLTTDLTD